MMREPEIEPILTEMIRELLEKGLPARLSIHGRSMWPQLKEGDLVSIGRATKIWAGSLVVWR